MFCHDRYSLLFVFEKKQHNRINSREETMGEIRGRREQIIAQAMIAYAAATAGGKMASICEGYGGWVTSAIRSPGFHA